MNNLKKIKVEQERIADFYQITSALRIIAATQSRQFSKRKKDYDPIRAEVTKVLGFLTKDKKYSEFFDKINANKPKTTLKIMFSADQKYCKNFLNSLHKLLRETQFASTDQIILFGSRSYKTLLEQVSEEQIKLYRAMSSFDECESLALTIKEMNYPDTYIYSYDSNLKGFSKRILTPFGSDETVFGTLSQIDAGYVSPKFDLDNLIHMYLSSEIYCCMIESGLKERVDRAMAMSEASNNAESAALELRRRYNTTRQAMITKEITTGS